MTKLTRILAASAVALALSMPAFAKEFRSADVHPDDYPTVMAVKKMSEIISEKTGGKYTIKVFGNSALGSEKDTVEQVKLGALDMVRVNVAAFNNIVPETIVPALPFLFKSKEHMRKVLDGPVGEQILTALESQGFIGLAFYDSGSRSFYTTSKPIKTVADVKGMKLRVQQSDLWVTLIQSMGGNPTPLPYAEVYTALKTGVVGGRPARIIETPGFVGRVVDRFAAIREAAGPEVDIAIDFHGAVSPQTAKVLVKALEPFQPMFVEEPVNCQNVEALAEIAHGTHLPIATGERVFTKWGFREVLEKRAATILQPDLCHAGGILEARLIAGIAESYYATIAPHNPLGPISLAAGIQLAASIPNFLCQEQVSLGVGFLKEPFVVEKGYVKVPVKPGLGIELDEEALASKLGHDWRNPETYDADDGSVVDW